MILLIYMHLTVFIKEAKFLQLKLSYFYVCNSDVPGMVNSGCAVNMTVSSLGIKLTSIESGKVLSNHDMQGISFASGGEKVSELSKL